MNEGALAILKGVLTGGIFIMTGAFSSLSPVLVMFSAICGSLVFYALDSAWDETK